MQDMSLNVLLSKSCGRSPAMGMGKEGQSQAIRRWVVNETLVSTRNAKREESRSIRELNTEEARAVDSSLKEGIQKQNPILQDTGKGQKAVTGLEHRRSWVPLLE